jgi:hypothetical protein
MARKEALPKLTDRIVLGASGLRVSPSCSGLSAQDVISAAFDAGIDFFFVTADMHWPMLSEEEEQYLLDLSSARAARARPSSQDRLSPWKARPTPGRFP